MTRTTERVAVPAAIAGAITISFSAIFFAASGVEPIVGAFYRMAYALPVLAVLVGFRPADTRRPRRDRLMAVAAGLFLALDLYTWHTAIVWIGAGLATLIVNSQVLIVPVVTWMLFGERPARVVLLATIPALAGLAVITGLGTADTFGEHPVLAVVYALAAAVFYTGFLVAFRRSNRSLAPTAGPLLDATLGAAAVSLVLALLAGEDLAFAWPAHGWLMALAVGSQAVGWLLIAYALPRLDAARTSFVIMLQPTLTLVWGRLFFAETPSPLQLVGVAVVWGTIAWVVTRRQTPPARSHSASSA